MSANIPDGPFRHLATSTVGIVFLGTPDRGTKSTKWGEMIALFGKALGYETEGRILKNVRKDSEPLVDRFIYLPYGYFTLKSLWLLGSWNTLQSSSFLPLVSHAGESSTHQGLYILSCRPNVGEIFISIVYLVLQLPSCGEYFKREKYLPPILADCLIPADCFTTTGPSPLCLHFTTLCRGENHLATHAL